MLLTTHSPFVPSDMPRENVLIFMKEDSGLSVRRPSVETFGATFDSILEDCFDVRPPISETPRLEIEIMMRSEDAVEIRELVGRLGDSVERAFLIDRIRQLAPKG